MTRFSASLPVVTLASLALVLSACGGGQSGADSQVSETSVVPPAATSSVSVSSSTSESVAPSAQTAESPAPSSSVPVALPTLASGKTVEFTPEELAAYQKGEYVPASEKHPAYNVPVPVMPEAATSRTVEGAMAVAEYWILAKNYTMQTGNGTYEESIMLSSFDVGIDLLNKYKDFYTSGSWAYMCFDKTKIESVEFDSQDNPVNAMVLSLPHDDKCKIFDKNGALVHDLPELSYNGKKSLILLIWENDSWKVSGISGLEGVDYGK